MDWGWGFLWQLYDISKRKAALMSSEPGFTWLTYDLLNWDDVIAGKCSPLLPTRTHLRPVPRTDAEGWKPTSCRKQTGQTAQGERWTQEPGAHRPWGQAAPASV